MPDLTEADREWLAKLTANWFYEQQTVLDLIYHCPSKAAWRAAADFALSHPEATRNG